MQQDILERVLAAPKAELHMHIEGSMEAELAFTLARRNGIRLPYADVAELKQALDFTDLQSFLDVYYACAAVLCTREDFKELMLAYLARAKADNIVYTEIFFDPQTHTERGIDIGEVITGLHEGLLEGHARYGIEGKLILCFLRHLSEEDGFATLEAARPWLHLIAGFGLDSGERGNPPSKFAQLFKACRETGKHVVAHAGEEGPPAYIREALDLLGAERIDHGVRAVEDQALVERLANEQVPLTVCPLSNIKLCVYPVMTDLPLLQLLTAGARVMLNSDDPAYFGGYLNDNLRAVHAAFDLDSQHWQTLLENSFLSAFVSEAQKRSWIANLRQHFS